MLKDLYLFFIFYHRMAPLSGAERAKRFREKNKERVREEDALRKRHARNTMKVTDPSKNRERLLKQRLYKMEYRKRVKDGDQTQNQVQIESTESLTESSLNRATLMRSLRKAEKSLPKSPRKQKAVVQGLAKKFNLRIVQTEKRGRKLNALADDERTWLNDFLNRPDIVHITPVKNDNVYMGKVDGKKNFKKKNICYGH